MSMIMSADLSMRPGIWEVSSIVELGNQVFGRVAEEWVSKSATKNLIFSHCFHNTYHDSDWQITFFYISSTGYVTTPSVGK